MKAFKKEFSKSIVICFLICVNLLLIVTVVIEEKHGHVFGSALERRDMVVLDKSSDYWAIVAWTNTIKKLNSTCDIVFFGNSITCGSDFQSDFPDKKILNFGYPGDNIRGMIRRIPMLQAANPDKIFIMAGTNDLYHVSLDEYEERYALMLNVIMDSLPNSKIYIQSVLPCNHEKNSKGISNKKIQEANKLAKNLAGKFNCTYINLYDLYVDNNNEMQIDLTRDGTHLYKESYKIWAKAIEYYIYN